MSTDEATQTADDAVEGISEEQWESIRTVASLDPQKYPAAKDARNILRNAGKEVPR